MAVQTATAGNTNNYNLAIAAVGCTIISTASVGLTSMQVMSSNSKRMGLIVYNNSANSVYLAFDTFCASATHMTMIIPTFAQWFMTAPTYCGPISAVRNAGSGILMITELSS